MIVWTRKKDTSEEMSWLVDYYDKLSNLLEDVCVLNIFSNFIEMEQYN